MASYLFVVTLHTTLWALVAFCLPRTSFLFSVTTPPWDPVQLSSLDHPQHPFLVALTRNPTHTLAWLTVGAAFLQSWWACWLRECQIRIRVQGTDAERRIDKAVHECHKFQVNANPLIFFTSSIVTISGLQGCLVSDNCDLLPCACSSYSVRCADHKVLYSLMSHESVFMSLNLVISSKPIS